MLRKRVGWRDVAASQEKVVQGGILKERTLQLEEASSSWEEIGSDALALTWAISRRREHLKLP